jgi:hypothetical protein
MIWQFNSTLVPFLEKIAPYDTFKIWKYGRSIRLDSTFAGFNGLKVKRRPRSIYFNALGI